MTPTIITIVPLCYMNAYLQRCHLAAVIIDHIPRDEGNRQNRDDKADRIGRFRVGVVPEGDG